MTLYAASPDPNDPDPDRDGKPNSQDDDDDDGDTIPDDLDPTPRPNPNPNPIPTPTPTSVVPPGPNPNPNPNPQAITLTATATNPTTIQLSWSGAAGTLYRSTQEGFAIGSETHIARGDDETNADVTSYTDTGLTPDTTYYYALVPSGNALLTEGRANAKTPDVARSAEASFKLLKANGNDAGATIGGAVAVVLELELENAKAGSENAVVRIQETGKENGVGHEPKDNHIDFALDLTDKAGWQQWIDADGDGPQLASWKAATSEPIGTGKWRWSYDWKTAGIPITMGEGDDALKLWNHNGEHTISLAKVDGVVSSTLEFGDEKADVEEEKAKVGNLVIKSVSTSNGTQDYFKFDSESSDSSLTNPTVTFEIEDEGDKHRYEWWLWVKPSSSAEQNSITFTGILPSDGSKTVVMNKVIRANAIDQAQAEQAEGYSQSHALTRWGTYTFEFRVKEIKTNSLEGIGEPPVELQSRKLLIPDHYTDAQGVGHRGHDMRFVSDDATSETKVKVDYYLEDSAGQPIAQTRNATSGMVVLLDGEMEAKEPKPLQPEVRVPREDVAIYTFNRNELGGEYRAIFTAEDGHAEEYRDHRNKRMMPANQKSVVKNFHIEDDWMVAPGGVAMNPHARDRAVWDAFMRPENKKLTTPWTKSNIIWGPIDAGFANEVAGHFSAGDTGPTSPYMSLKASKSDFAELDSYSTDGFTPPGGVSRFQHYFDRDGPSDYWVGPGWNRTLVAGYHKAHAKARYVHVVGAGKHLNSNGGVPADDLVGLSSSAGDIRPWKRSRWSFIFIEDIKPLAVTASTPLNNAIVGTTIHELGHQFNTFDDHETSNSDLWSGIPGEDQAIKRFLKPETKEQGLKELALYRGRLKPGVTNATNIADFQHCVGSAKLYSDFIFCEYHKNVIDTYTGW